MLILEPSYSIRIRILSLSQTYKNVQPAIKLSSPGLTSLYTDVARHSNESQSIVMSHTDQLHKKYLGCLLKKKKKVGGNT